MRRVSAKYLNRYVFLFSRVWRGDSNVVDDIYNSDVRMKNLTIV